MGQRDGYEGAERICRARAYGPGHRPGRLTRERRQGADTDHHAKEHGVPLVVSPEPVG